MIQINIIKFKYTNNNQYIKDLSLMCLKLTHLFDRKLALNLIRVNKILTWLLHPKLRLFKFAYNRIIIFNKNKKIKTWKLIT